MPGGLKKDLWILQFFFVLCDAFFESLNFAVRMPGRVTSPDASHEAEETAEQSDDQPQDG